MIKELNSDNIRLLVNGKFQQYLWARKSPRENLLHFGRTEYQLTFEENHLE